MADNQGNLPSMGSEDFSKQLFNEVFLKIKALPQSLGGYYCIPRDKLPQPTADLSNESLQYALIRRLIRVKVDPSKKQTRHERIILQRIYSSRQFKDQWRPHIRGMLLKTDEGRSRYIRTETLPGCTINEYLDRCGAFPSFFVFHIFLELCEALRYLHGVGVVFGEVDGDMVIVQDPFADALPSIVIAGFATAAIKGTGTQGATGHALAADNAVDVLKLVDNIAKREVPEQLDITARIHPLMDNPGEKLRLVDPEHGFLQFANNQIDYRDSYGLNKNLTIESLWSDWEEVAKVERDNRPEEFPYWMEERIGGLDVTREEIVAAIERERVEIARQGEGGD